MSGTLFTDDRRKRSRGRSDERENVREIERERDGEEKASLWNEERNWSRAGISGCVFGLFLIVIYCERLWLLVWNVCFLPTNWESACGSWCGMCKRRLWCFIRWTTTQWVKCTRITKIYRFQWPIINILCFIIFFFYLIKCIKWNTFYIRFTNITHNKFSHNLICDCQM